MKHKFLLDENILHFAINGIDEYDQPDDTSTVVIKQIGLNCHTIVVNKFMLERYWYQIKKIQSQGRRPRALEPVAFISQLLMNSQKWSLNSQHCPDLPGAGAIPAEDVEIAKFAVMAKALVISGDSGLRDAINGCPALGIRAITQKQALPFVAET